MVELVHTRVFTALIEAPSMDGGIKGLALQDFVPSLIRISAYN